ncbi:hypothetical protein [Pseudomonas helleri]|uniref:hypothetical protein n=1 Tax=Pseudomonas helleri TaxID=1608996 RepID=UPI0028EB7319|nr:hypothetical protein [Pseudomonas helleri]
MTEAAGTLNSPFRERLYELEAEYCKHYKFDDSEASRLHAEISALLLENCPDWHEFSQRELGSIFDIYQMINISGETIRRLADMEVGGLSDSDSSSFQEAINYVEGITELDLSSVKEVRLNRYDCIYSEGECVACDKNNHHVYYSLDSNQVSSVDLLCHEVGHAADFINARTEFLEDNSLHRHQSLAEAVAFYCQFRYLIEYGDEKKRTASLGAFLYTYLAYLLCCHCFNNKIPLDQIEPYEAVEDEIFSSFIAAYLPRHGEEVARDFVAGKISAIQNQYQDLSQVIFMELNARLGIPLALALLSIHNSNLYQVSKSNILSVELKEVVQGIDSGILGSLSNLDVLIAKYIG